MASRPASTVLRKAREGDVESQLKAGKLYLEGSQGLRRDAATAFYWLRAAAAQGSAEAQALIGKSIPQSSVKQPESVVQYYERASDRGSAHADVALSDWVLTGRIPGNDSRAYELLHRSATAGDRKAQLRFAILLESGAFGTGREPEAIQWYEKAAGNGSRAAAVALANWHWMRNDPAARTWIDALAGSVDPENLYRRAVLLISEGEPRRASAALEEAATRGHAMAQLSFGLLHSAAVDSSITGVPHGLKRAASWLERASRGGVAQASFELYRLFRRRQFSMKSASMAYRYLETAARQGHAHAQFLLGLALLRDSVTENADLGAARWFARASQQGHAEAAALVAILYRRNEMPLFADSAEAARLIRVMARSRIALATRLEMAVAFGLNAPEMLLFDPEVADHADCLLIDIRSELPRLKRRIILVQSESERALLDQARRLLSSKAPHPTDVRGAYLQRKLDFEHTLTLLGGDISIPPLR